MGLILLGIVGAVAIYQTPAFHSYVSSPGACIPTVAEIKGHLPCGDPSTLLWKEGASAGNLNMFNTGGATSFCTAGNCGSGSTGTALGLTASSGNTSMAITKNPMPDFGVANGKTLELLFSVGFGPDVPACDNSCTFGVFLTTNQTIPNHTSASLANYDPRSDISVQWLLKMFRPDSTHYEAVEYFNRNPGSTISIGDSGGTCPSSGSCYLDTGSVAIPSVTVPPNALEYLNYSAATNAGGCGAIFVGAGCSWNSLQSDAGGIAAKTQVFPPTILSGQKLYLGFYSTYGPSSGVNWLFENNNGVMDMQIVTPTPTAAAQPPNVDTGGFFGPIIRTLIVIAVFMAQNIISFFQFLVNLLAPVYATAVASLSTVMVAIFNALGGVFGYSSLGTQLVGLVNDFSGFLTNSFRNLTGIVSSIVTMINNIVTFASSFVTNNSFTTLLFGIVGVLPNVWTVLNSVWPDLAKWFVGGQLTLAGIFEIDWLLGTLWTAVEGFKGFREWLDINELIILKIFQMAYWLFELGLDVAYKLIMIIKGRVLWFQVAAEG